ncbi:hypothetical protein AWH62_11820 [Maricaulis sp. W15]|uniref:Secreted protein n=1 Tax=Maricaulis maris TaxID=74318 RepID=A0A495CY44_9PROT|nr:MULTISPECIES: hypothetical protein [Maricaulis]OLF71816.1 hypothetical protein AWH62_11820 [Maricaulis sp. W15]RKQ94232.1 hypothetical protein C7435_3206 [Maricaulis maris]
MKLWPKTIATIALMIACAPTDAQVKPGQNQTAGTSQTAANDGAQVAQLLNDVVARDSRSWLFNRYDNGSMRNARILSHTPNSGDAVIQGDYTYNGGRGGWVRVTFTNNQVRCVTYHDFPGTCRPVGAANPAIRALGGLMLSGAMGNGSGSTNSGTNRQCRMVQEQICPPDGSYCRTYNVERCN